jgi:hypothetical protein
MHNILDRHRIKHPSHLPDSKSFRAVRLYRPSGTEDPSEPSRHFERGPSDEVLIADARASLRPAEWVERKLISLLKSVYLPVSHVRTTPLCKGRGRSSDSSLQPDRESQVATSVTSIGS